MFSDQCFVLQDGRTPLHWASESGHSNIVYLLLSYRGNVNVKDKVSECILKKNCIWQPNMVSVTYFSCSY